MMSQQLDFSILTAPLAAVDRRALSQAWYSALHLAARPAAPSDLARAVAHTDAPGRDLQLVASPAREGRAEPHAAARPLQERGGGVTVAAERRAERSSLARRIERVFCDPARRTQRASFTLEGTSARVHVTLQSNASGTHIVAVCSPAARAAVTRALEQARYALAARGIALRVDVSEA
ncbi:MAG TPA: hypothetical protein VMA98_12330 [Candidatus Acidoferrales bacterium]|nr:hypothetical protein [Candidatus Acidoferrales bacterium]